MDAAPLIRDHVAWMRAAGLADHNCVDRERLLRRLDRGLPLGLAYTSHDELVAWLGNPTWGRQTKATYRTHIIGFYSWATNAGRFPFDPSEGLPRPKVPKGMARPVPDDVLARILADAREPYRTWAKLAAYGGLRCCEVSRLDREHMNEQGIAVHGKGDRPGWVPMHPVIWDAVKDLPPGPVARKAGRRATPGDVSLMFWQHVRTLGVQTSMHRLRAWCATEIVRLTGNPMYAQEVLRHASIATTMVYVKLDRQGLAGAVAALPTLVS